MSHTPGPWGILKAGNQWSVAPVTARGKPRDGRDTEDVCHGSQLTDNWQTDARLLAAAPEMLEALKRILNHPMSRMDDTTERAVRAVALVHRERERSYGYGYRKGRADAEGEVQKLVSLVAKAWFQYHPQAGI